jgi:hypothetical protein
MKDKILQLDFKALKIGLDLGIHEVKQDKQIDLGSPLQLKSPKSDNRDNKPPP